VRGPRVFKRPVQGSGAYTCVRVRGGVRRCVDYCEERRNLLRHVRMHMTPLSRPVRSGSAGRDVLTIGEIARPSQACFTTALDM